MKKKRFKKIYIEITNICNLKCSFCPETKRAKKYMEINDFKTIINKVKQYTNLITLHIKGEPLLHPNLNEILKICEEENIKINITTNGTLLKDKKDVISKYSSVRQINISLHSINKNESNNMYDFNEYLENIFESVEDILNRQNTIISYRLWNLENLEENDENKKILEFLEEKYNVKNLKEIAKKEEFVELDKKVFLNQDIEFKWPDMELDVISETGTCRALKDQIGVLVDGSVVPCCLDQEGDIKLGNLLENDLEEILNFSLTQEILKGFNENRLVHNLCKRCGYRTKF